MAGDSGYDVVSTSTDYFSRQIKAGIYQPLDKSQLPNWKNLDPHVLAVEAAADPGNRYAMPYLRHVNGFAYNVDLVKARMPDAPVDSLDMLFKPQIIAHFADCGVTFLDSPKTCCSSRSTICTWTRTRRGREDYAQAEKLLLGGAALHPRLRLHRIHERTRQQGILHRHVVVGRLRDLAGARQGGRRRREPRVHRAQGGRQRLLRCVADSGGRAAPAGGASSSSTTYSSRR